MEDLKSPKIMETPAVARGGNRNQPENYEQTGEALASQFTRGRRPLQYRTPLAQQQGGRKRNEHFYPIRTYPRQKSRDTTRIITALRQQERTPALPTSAADRPDRVIAVQRRGVFVFRLQVLRAQQTIEAARNLRPAPQRITPCGSATPRCRPSPCPSRARSGGRAAARGRA